MNTQTNWKEYTGSDEQIAELEGAKNGVLVRLLDDPRGENEFILQGCDNFYRGISEYWLIPDDPLRDMKIRQAMTGQPVWVKIKGRTDIFAYYTPTADPCWNIPNAEYSFTEFKD